MAEELKTYEELDARQRRVVTVLETCLGAGRLAAVNQVQAFDAAELDELDEIHDALTKRPLGDRVRQVMNSHIDRVAREKAAADAAEPASP